MSKNMLPNREIMERLLRDGLKIEQIAARYGTVPETVRQRIKIYGLRHLAPYKTPKTQRVLTKESVLADRRAGMSFFAIDNKHGLSMGATKRFAQSVGIATEFEAFTIQKDKTIVGRRVSAGEYGGSAHRKISLPRIAMHVDALLERSAA